MSKRLTSRFIAITELVGDVQSRQTAFKIRVRDLEDAYESGGWERSNFVDSDGSPGSNTQAIQ